MKYNSKIAKTIDSCATLIETIGIIISLIAGFVTCFAGNIMIIIGIGVIVIGILLSVIVFYLITGFAHLIESTNNIEKYLCSPSAQPFVQGPNSATTPYSHMNTRCPNCGTVNDPTAPFCTGCGNRLK